jgi:hypothetical protein
MASYFISLSETKRPQLTLEIIVLCGLFLFTKMKANKLFIIILSGLYAECLSAQTNNIKSNKGERLILLDYSKAKGYFISMFKECAVPTKG